MKCKLSPRKSRYREQRENIYIVYISDWEFKEATLIRELDDGTVVPNGEEGLLFVTLISKQTGEERRGTVCDDGFKKQAAQLFCRSMGYRVADSLSLEWGIPLDYRYVSM